MTQEEYQAEQEERARLIDEINRVTIQIQHAKNVQYELQAELNTLVHNMGILTSKIAAEGNAASRRLSQGQEIIGSADKDVSDLYYAIDYLASSYFKFKEMSTASKNVTDATDEYFTKYKEFNRLRRIVLGYVIGLDQNFASSETMRRVVEKVYLQNTDYWLAYAAAAVMLWSSDEREAAARAVNKAVYMDYSISSVFFLLINLRFTRVEAAKKWYLAYLDRVDLDHLGAEWEQLLEAYLSGVFGVEPAFTEMVQSYFANMFEQLESTHPTFGMETADKTVAYASNYLHVTSNEFEGLRRYCPEYEEMKTLLGEAEKNAVLTEQFRGYWDAGTEPDETLYERVEDILYDLISTPVGKEDEVLRKIDLNKKILRAKGDVVQAQKAFDYEHAETEKKTLADLLFKWGFSSENKNVDNRVRRFSIGYLKKYIARGFQKFAQDYRLREKERYVIEIDGWKESCDENSYEKASGSLSRHYSRDSLKNVISDKYAVVFIAMLVASVVALALCAVSFNKVVLTAGILLGVAGGFLLWRRIVDLNEMLAAKLQKSLTILRQCIMEIGQWRTLYHKADMQNEDLVGLFETIDS